MAAKRRVHKPIRFSYYEVAALRGVSVHAVRQAVRRGVLDPRDLASIYRYAYKKHCREIVATLE